MKPIKLLALIVIALIAAINFDAEVNGYSKQNAAERPVVNPPVTLRQRNWNQGNPGDGSCTWASIVSLLRWEEQYKLADWIRRNRSGGEWLSKFGSRLDKANVHYAIGPQGSVEFLEAALRTRRGIAIPIDEGRHMVALVHLDEYSACLLDNNHPEYYDWLKRDEFIEEWRKAGGWAFVPVYSPMAPLP